MTVLDDEAFLNAPPPSESTTDSQAETVDEVVEEQTTVETSEPKEKEEATAVVVEKPKETIELPNQVVEITAEDKTEEAKETVTKDAVQTVDYEARYKEALAPLKANGKTVDIQSLDELRQLASMGANFTRKMQDIAPHRKILAMLENNGLLDESKLSFYIDLDKKNPGALQKLIKDSGVDPLDIDVSKEPTYQAGNHSVTDAEITFRAVLEDLQSTPTGKETISVINTQWDQASKEELWKSPEVMATIQQQRENGIYDVISTEINRQAVLGKIPAGTPFIQAYLSVGNELNTRGAFSNMSAPNNHGVQNVSVQTKAQVPVLVATRVAVPKPQVTNSAAANAAASTRQTQKRVVPVVNLQNMSDDDFLKTWHNRL